MIAQNWTIVELLHFYASTHWREVQYIQLSYRVQVCMHIRTIMDTITVISQFVIPIAQCTVHEKTLLHM